MIKVFCDRCDKEISPDINDEYVVNIDVKTTGWVGNRNEDYYYKDIISTDDTKRFFICKECLNKLNNIVCDFVYPQQEQKDGELCQKE